MLQLTQKYPEISTPENIWIIGITRNTQACYLVFCLEIRSILDKLKQINEDVEYMEYCDFSEIKQIGTGGYGTVYTARYDGMSKKHINVLKAVVLKCFKGSDKLLLFASEVSTFDIIN